MDLGCKAQELKLIACVLPTLCRTLLTPSYLQYEWRTCVTCPFRRLMPWPVTYLLLILNLTVRLFWQGLDCPRRQHTVVNLEPKSLTRIPLFPLAPRCACSDECFWIFPASALPTLSDSLRGFLQSCFSSAEQPQSTIALSTMYAAT